MGKLEERSDGYFVLDVQLGAIRVERAFMPSDKPLEAVSEEPMDGGFVLIIPDTETE